MKSTFGYSVHVGTDENGFIHSRSITSGNVHDSQELDNLILGTETALYADAAYYSKATTDKLKRLGINNKVQKKGYRNTPLTEEDKLYNKEISVIRSGVERTFAVYKRNYGLAKTRFLGMARNEAFFTFVAIAHNIQKACNFVKKYGLRNMAATG